MDVWPRTESVSLELSDIYTREAGTSHSYSQRAIDMGSHFPHDIFFPPPWRQNHRHHHHNIRYQTDRSALNRSKCNCSESLDRHQTQECKFSPHIESHKGIGDNLHRILRNSQEERGFPQGFAFQPLDQFPSNSPTSRTKPLPKIVLTKASFL